MDTSKPGRKGPVSVRLQASTDELLELEQLIQPSDIDSSMLRDFRGAVDHIRTTVWAVQQWIELRERGSDPYPTLPVLARERVRRTTQLSKDLDLDLQTAEISIETEGLEDLFQAVDGLHRRLAPLFKGKA
jgi:hypothetical protein